MPGEVFRLTPDPPLAERFPLNSISPWLKRAKGRDPAIEKVVEAGTSTDPNENTAISGFPAPCDCTTPVYVAPPATESVSVSVLIVTLPAGVSVPRDANAFGSSGAARTGVGRRTQPTAVAATALISSLK